MSDSDIEYALSGEIVERLGLAPTPRRIEFVRRMIVLLESAHFDEPVTT